MTNSENENSLPIEALSKDGFIIDQTLTKGLDYGRLSSDINGCGWIAMYNMMHALMLKTSYQDVYQKMNDILIYHGYLGTPMKTMKAFLDKSELSYQIVKGKKNALRSALISEVGIIRYFEGNELHFVTYQRKDNDQYRFFNAISGKHDHLLSMNDFFTQHCRLPFVLVIVLK